MATGDNGDNADERIIVVICISRFGWFGTSSMIHMSSALFYTISQLAVEGKTPPPPSDGAQCCEATAPTEKSDLSPSCQGGPTGFPCQEEVKKKVL